MNCTSLARCLTEAVAGSDPCAVQCRADRTEEGGYTVSGTKTWVTNGQQGQWGNLKGEKRMTMK